MDWPLLYLKDDPFALMPAREGDAVIWAGQKSSRVWRRLLQVMEQAASGSPSFAVLGRGRWGAGKTHAALYFQQTASYPAAADVKPVPIYLKTPPEGESPVDRFYVDVLEKLTWSGIREAISNLAAEKGPDASSYLERMTNSDFALALTMIGSESDERILLLLRQYLYAQTKLSPTRLESLGIARTISGSTDRIRMLGAIITALTSGGRRKVFLWLDELEGVVYYSAAVRRRFTQSLRDLLDAVPTHFYLFLNFTSTVPERETDIELVLGGALMDRIKYHVPFDEPNVEEATEYVQDLMGHFRTNEFKGARLNQEHPFTRDGLWAILEGLSADRTPRNINKACSALLSLAFEEKPPRKGEPFADQGFVKQSLDRVLAAIVT